MAVSDKTHSKGDEQFAALPWRLTPSGELEVLVITSRETRRWVLPKGWPMKDRTPVEAAAQEAWEEAGVIGIANSEQLGGYSYGKRLRDGAVQEVKVAVFALKVLIEQFSWPEQDQREKRWSTPAEAADLVDEPALKDLVRAFKPM